MATEDFSGTLANWTQWQPAWGDAFISSGTLRFPGGGSPSNDTGIRWSGAGAGSFGPAQESAADIAGATWIANWAGVGVRMAGSNATRDGYFARLDDNAATNKLLELVKFVDGVQTVLASTTYATGSSFRLRLTVEDSGGNAQLRVYVGATLVTALNHTDSSSPLTGGDPGLIGRGNSGLTMDNWEGGTFTPPVGIVITGPSGAAGAASITHAVNELQNNGGTWSATGGTAWSLTGTDAGLLSISSGGVVTLASGNFDRETRASYSFNVLRDAAAQAVTLNITNVNEAPSFSGPDISVPGLVVGVAMSSINAALLFADPDAGDTGTYSAVGTWPAGVTVNSAGLISGTPSAAGTSSNLRVRRTDGGALTADSNLFSITVSASSTPVNFTGTVSAQSGTVGSAFSWAGSALASFFSGSLTPFTYNVSAGSLPPGLTLNASTGVVSGTPTTAGTFNATFRALDTGSNAATSNSVAFTIAAAPPPPPGPTLPAVATDATGSAKRLAQTTRMVVEPFTNIESLGTGTRTIATGTTDPTTGQITLTGLPPGTYAVFGFFPSTGATIQGVRFRLVTVS